VRRKDSCSQPYYSDAETLAGNTPFGMVLQQDADSAGTSEIGNGHLVVRRIKLRAVHGPAVHQHVGEPNAVDAKCAIEVAYT